MKQFLITAGAIGLLTLLSMMVFPWWVVAFISAGVAWVMKLKPGTAFLYGFILVALVFFFQAFFIDNANEGLLSRRIGGLFGGVGPLGLMIISAVPAAIAAGLGGLTGSYLRRVREPEANSEVS